MAPPTPRSMWRAPSGALYPLVDSNAALLATVTEADVELGKPGDPCHCAIACAFMRAAGAEEVMIGRSIAYVVLRRNKELVAFRFAVPAHTRRPIDQFDETRQMPVGALELKPIPDYNRLESKRAQQKRLRERWTEMGKAKTKKKPPLVTARRNASALAVTAVVKRHESD